MKDESWLYFFNARFYHIRGKTFSTELELVAGMNRQAIVNKIVKDEFKNKWNAHELGNSEEFNNLVKIEYVQFKPTVDGNYEIDYANQLLKRLDDNTEYYIHGLTVKNLEKEGTKQYFELLDGKIIEDKLNTHNI